MKKSCPLFLAVSALIALMVGCESIDTSVFGGSFGRNSSAMVGGGAVAGQDYVIGLTPSEAAQQYFAASSPSDEKTVTVTPGDDKGTGVTWTDDGGIVIPPGTTIVFTNKGCCLDPHLPAPKAEEEMQFIKTSCLIPTQLQGTYKNLLRRAGEDEVKANLQHLMWTLRTAGSNDAYAKNLTDRQREILAECAEAGSFDSYCQDLHRFDGIKNLFKTHVTDKLQVEIGNVTYKVSDLLDPELGKQKVSAHLGELIHMNEYLPVVQSGFNFGELQKGIYTDIKGNGSLSFKAKIANATSEPFVFYPMDYVAQVGSGQNMQGAFFAAADSTMRQRTTTTIPDSLIVAMIYQLGQIIGNGALSTGNANFPGAKRVVDEFHRVKDLSAAAKWFESQLRNSGVDYINSKTEFYAIVYKYNGDFYMTDLSSGTLTDNMHTQSSTMSIDMNSFWDGTSGRDALDTEIISVIHSHPAGDKSDLFSMADQNFVLQGVKAEIDYGNGSKKVKTDYPSLILVDTGHESGWWFWRTYDKYILEHGFKKRYDESIFEKRGKPFK